MATQVEKMVHRMVSGQNALYLAGRFEPPHRARLLARAWVGPLGVVFQALVLAMLDARHDLFLGRRRSA